MQSQAFLKIMSLVKLWTNEASNLTFKADKTEFDIRKSLTLLDCANALNNTLKEITDDEKKIISTNSYRSLHCG